MGANFAPCAAQGYTGATAYPINFFTPNPYATRSAVPKDDGNVNYNAMQVEARKQTSHGLTITANLVWSHSMGDLLNASDQTATYQWFTQRNARLSYGPTPFDRRVAFNSYWTYELPVGKGSRSTSITGYWTALWAGGCSAAWSRSPPVALYPQQFRDTFNNLVQSGVVFGNGFTMSQLQSDLSQIPSFSHVVCGNLVSNVAPVSQSSGIANPSYYAPASTPGVFSDSGVHPQQHRLHLEYELE